MMKEMEKKLSHSMLINVSMDEGDKEEKLKINQNEKGEYIIELSGKINKFHFHFGPGPS